MHPIKGRFYGYADKMCPVCLSFLRFREDHKTTYCERCENLKITPRQRDEQNPKRI